MEARSTFFNVTWSVPECREFAGELLDGMFRRWRHVMGVAALAEQWAEAGLVRESVVQAAWLHDVGYAKPLVRTGMHSIDGAAYLDLHGVDRDVVALVAHHTGAWAEAEERGLSRQLLAFDLPDEQSLDALTLADLLSGPRGQRLTVSQRLTEILERYEPEHPVHRAVARSGESLVQSATRASARLGYPM